MQLPEHIFKANDIRGLLEEVSPEVAYLAGRAIVRKTGAKTVVVGRDMRSTSEALQAEAIRGIRSMGADALNIGLTTTSVFNFAISSLKNVDAGLMVTASHNPAEYNGIKFGDGSGLPISGPAILDEIKKDDGALLDLGKVTDHNVVEEYVEACIKNANLPDVKGMKIAVDYGNGMGTVAFRPLAKRLGLELTELYAEPDARFPNHEANPNKRETLAEIEKLLASGDFAFGAALDGDADRIGFLDNKGVPLRGDETLALLAADELERNPGATIIYQPNHTWATLDAINEHGGKGVQRQIGRTRVVEGMRTEGAKLGGEVSSHFFFAEFAGLEAVDFAFCRMLSLIAKAKKPLSKISAPLRKYSNSWEVNFEVHDKVAATKRVEDAYVSQASSVNRLDGIRCEFGRDWWFILRASNTEPLLRLIVEATSKELMEAKRDELAKIIQG
ncbi:MAG: phosphomannomutase/phosphoglucomutase [Patescibacteria group bacterium]|jgi:phosphomannomutase